MIIAGSYPPIPVPAADSTLDAVRRALRDGEMISVVSPRPSAAHYSVPLLGPFAGRRLDRLRRMEHAERFVLVVEPGIPFDEPGSSTPFAEPRAMLTALSLARAMRRFDHTTVIVAGDTGAPSRAVGIITSAADEVIDDIREGRPPSGVTTRGPLEMRPRDRARRIVGGVARRLLRRASNKHA